MVNRVHAQFTSCLKMVGQSLRWNPCPLSQWPQHSFLLMLILSLTNDGHQSWVSIVHRTMCSCSQAVSLEVIQSYTLENSRPKNNTTITKRFFHQSPLIQENTNDQKWSIIIRHCLPQMSPMALISLVRVQITSRKNRQVLSY